jgi:hypothetical protein
MKQLYRRAVKLQQMKQLYRQAVRLQQMQELYRQSFKLQQMKQLYRQNMYCSCPDSSQLQQMHQLCRQAVKLQQMQQLYRQYIYYICTDRHSGCNRCSRCTGTYRQSAATDDLIIQTGSQTVTVTCTLYKQVVRSFNKTGSHCVKKVVKQVVTGCNRYNRHIACIIKLYKQAVREVWQTAAVIVDIQTAVINP